MGEAPVKNVPGDRRHQRTHSNTPYDMNAQAANELPFTISKQPAISCTNPPWNTPYEKISPVVEDSAIPVHEAFVSERKLVS